MGVPKPVKATGVIALLTTAATVPQLGGAVAWLAQQLNWQETTLRTYLSWGGIGFLVVYLLLTWSETFARFLRDLLSAEVRDFEAKTLSELKSELAETLSKSPPVLVTVDDIDRLTNREVAELFQLIKANADFPSLTYLVLFDRVRISKVLNLMDFGPDFLDKIVQVPLNVPAADADELQEIFLSEVKRVLDAPGIAKRWDTKRWKKLAPHIAPFFGNLRQVGRLCGPLGFGASLLLDDEVFEVCPVDLVAVETVRVFEPDVYAEMMRAQAVLTSDRHEYGADELKEAARAQIAEIEARAASEFRASIPALLRVLFPQITTLDRNLSFAGDTTDSWYRAGRICDPAHFPKYFRLATSARQVSLAEMELLVRKFGDREGLRQLFQSYSKRELLVTVFQQLEAHLKDLSADRSHSLVVAAMDVGDGLPRSMDWLTFDADVAARRLIHWALKRIQDPSERAAVLVKACHDSEGIVLPIVVTRTEEPSKQREKEDAPLLNAEQLSACRKQIVNRIRDAAASRALQQTEFLPLVLQAWLDWTDGADVRDWVRGWLTSKQAALLFLRRFCRRIVERPLFNDGSEMSTTRVWLKLQQVEQFTDIDAILRLLDSKNELMKAGDTEAAAAFRAALRRREQGQEDDAPWFD